jgi:hypothetical protein
MLTHQNTHRHPSGDSLRRRSKRRNPAHSGK